MKKALKYFPLVTAVLALAALIVGLAAPAVIVSEEIAYSGWKSVFGFKEVKDVIIGEQSIEYLKFSFWNLLLYILLIVGIAACVVSFVKPELSWLGYVAAGCFTVAAVFFFCSVGLTQAGKVYTLEGSSIEALVKTQSEAKEAWKLGAGAIVGAILSILAVLCAAAPPVLALLQKKKIIKLK